MASEDPVNYKIKHIEFLGRTVPIVCQNVNGPCPLLGIANVLSLRNVIRLRGGENKEISHAELLSIVGNRLLEANDAQDMEEEYRVNTQQNIADALSMLPKLATGVDVNVRFQHIHDFEFTSESAIFDLLDVRLVHGWLYDPQDERVAKVIGSRSYNELVEKIVEVRSELETTSSMSSGEQAGSQSVTTSSELQSKQTEPEDDSDQELLLQALALSMEGAPSEPSPTTVNTTEEESATVSAPLPTTVETTEEPLTSAESDTDFVANLVKTIIDDVISEGDQEVPEVQDKLHTSSDMPSEAKDDQAPIEAPPLDPENINMDISDSEPPPSVVPDPAPSQLSDTEIAAKMEQADAIEGFLNASASQLTDHGLRALRDGVVERQLCVFFRNNHFSTLFKKDDVLYVLVTDQGYLNEERVIWERCDQVGNDNLFVNGEFKPFTTGPAVFQPNTSDEAWLGDAAAQAAALLSQAAAGQPGLAPPTAAAPPIPDPQQQQPPPDHVSRQQREQDRIQREQEQVERLLRQHQQQQQHGQPQQLQQQAPVRPQGGGGRPARIPAHLSEGQRHNLQRQQQQQEAQQARQLQHQRYLEEQQRQQQQQQPHQQRQASGVQSGARPVAAAGVGGTDTDSDYALALQLQSQYEAEEAAARQRAQQQQQQQQQNPAHTQRQPRAANQNTRSLQSAPRGSQQQVQQQRGTSRSSQRERGSSSTSSNMMDKMEKNCIIM